MKYFIVGKNNLGELEWNGCDSPAQAASFIKKHYKDVLKRCNYDWKLVHKEIIILVVPEIVFAAIHTEPPVEEVVSVYMPKFSGWENSHGDV